MIELAPTQTILAPIHSVIVTAHVTSAKRWRSLLTERPDLALPLDVTTRANFINDHVCSEVEKGIAGIAGFRSTRALDFYGVVAGRDDEVLLRFKYLGNGVPRNVPTGQQSMLAKQTYDEGMMEALSIEGVGSPPTLITAGYTLDDESTIARIEIRRDCKNHLPWRYEIYGAGAVVEPIPLPGMKDTTKPARVTSRKAREAIEEAPDFSAEQQ